MKQAIIYARFSPRPNPDLATSIEVQLEKCKQYCEYRGLDILAEYRDANTSGKSVTNRPGLQQAMVHVCKIKGILVVYSLDRFTRSILDAITLSTQLSKCKADLCLLDMNIDTSTPIGQVFYQIMAAFAEFQRKITATRTSEALLFRQANGQRVSDKPPFGYKISPFNSTRLILNEDEQKIISLILTFNKQGLRLREICRELEKGGFKPRGKGWHHPLIANILEKYGRKI